MVYGPCGGVRVGGGCEMVPGACVFEDLTEPSDGLLGDLAAPFQDSVGQRAGRFSAPVILTDLSVPPGDAATLRAVARLLAPSCDAVLVGDHQDRPDFPPSMLARLITDAGAVPWVTMTCRDRNRITLEQELRALALDQLATVLCVTGDGRAYDVRPDVTQAFDLDGTRLAALAASLGLTVAVAETPTAPPVALRPRRLVHKQQVSARVGALNHVPTTAQLVQFLSAARVAGLRMPVIASVAVFTDQRSAAVLLIALGLVLIDWRYHLVLHTYSNRISLGPSKSGGVWGCCARWATNRPSWPTSGGCSRRTR